MPDVSTTITLKGQVVRSGGCQRASHFNGSRRDTFALLVVRTHALADRSHRVGDDR